MNRTLVFELHVPEQAPQVPQDVHAPSTEIDKIGPLKTSDYISDMIC